MFYKSHVLTWQRGDKMKKTIKQQVEKCVEDLNSGNLRESSLLKIIELIDHSKTQDILYLQAKNTSLTSEILGMRIIEAGVISDGPADPKDWPYQTVLEAINDGWRVIKFPEMSLMLDGSRTYGLGFDFILERY